MFTEITNIDALEIVGNIESPKIAAKGNMTDTGLSAGAVTGMGCPQTHLTCY